MEGPHTGLSSQDARRRLCDVIEQEGRTYEEELGTNRTLLSIFSPRSCFGSTVLFTPASALFLLSCGVALFASAVIIPDIYVLIEAFFLVLFCGLNCCLSGWDLHLKRRELIDHCRSLLKHLEDLMVSGGEWTTKDYLPLHIPESSSISLQWTLRDGELLNMPQALLVEGDIVFMRPGRPAPGTACKLTDESVVLNSGQVFLPDVEAISPDAAIRTPLRPEKFIMQETPYKRFLRECLEQGYHHPVTLLENRRLMVCHFIERVIIPAVLILSLIVNVSRYLATEGDTGHWAEMFIVLQVNVILPLCPMAFPLMWIVLNNYGIGRLVALFHLSRQRLDGTGERLGFSEEDNIMDKTPRVTWKEIFRHSLSSFRGGSSHLPRTANLLHGLGTVTSFSCVDKQGILSYPDPTIEKVFFISGSREHSVDGFSSTNSIISEDSQLGRPTDWMIDQEDSFPQTHAEVLTISANNDSSTGLQFDEPDWEKHLSSLKPMGLNILLNACHPEIIPNYFQFLDHVYTVTASRLDQQPVCPQRRCLCQAAYLMGFTEEAAQHYKVEQQIAMYKALPSGHKSRAGGSFRRGSVVQRRNLVPHGLSIIVRDHYSSDYQVMTQGSVQLVLSLCTEFWDGLDLHPLTDSDRKKILDFYSRAKLSSYCSVLSYQPVVDFLPEPQDNLYIELPPARHKHGSKPLGSPDISRSSWEVHVPISSMVPELPKPKKCRSLDSAIDTAGSLPVGEECVRSMSGQIFVGMVTLNFHPKSDIVTFIEQLDQACIRFVHFSEDQELRSKVFAEKMGLEAGWNCHISLKSGAYSSPGSHSQGSLAGIEQLELDLEAQRVRFREDSAGNVHEETEVIQTTNELNDESSEVMENVDETEHLLQGSGCETGGNMDGRRGGSDRSSCHGDEEQHPLLEDRNFRQRQISETQTCSEGTDVETTESVTGGVDVSNRGHLPRGIEKMRPHIENIDNVPLQVPLFTDVTPATTKEMIEIMQENNEVVCVLGSSVRLTNMSLFAQADFSIGLEPLYPHICLQRDCSREEVISINQDSLLPMELTARLISLPCSIYFHRNDNISISAIVQEACILCQGITNCFTFSAHPQPCGWARILCQGITNCFTFFLYAILTISAISFLSSLFLPPPLSGRHILWLSVFVAPWLSLSLVGTPGGSEVMRWATGKNTYKANRKNIFMLFGCFAAKFGGIILVTLSCHVLTLNGLCVQQNTTRSCHLTYGNREYTGPWNGPMEEAGSHLALSQNLNMFLISVYLVVVSSSFVHPLMLLWRHTPINNGVWCFVSLFIVVLAVVLLVLVTPLFLEPHQPSISLRDVPLPVWLLGCIWPLPNLIICEAVKVLEIREYVRWQKRSKLLFDTKLGMNSPF